jgi:tetratricopeptide (TPR) repeat protein
MKQIKHQILLAFLMLTGTCILAQDKEKDINRTLLEEACKCIAKIDLDLEKTQKTDSIKECITNAIMMDQMTTLLKDASLQEAIDKSKVDSTVVSTLNFTITADKDYEKIQKELLENCPAVKEIMLTNNKEFKNSYSDNKKALEFYKEGERYFNREEYESALIQFNKAVAKDPKFAFAWDNMGICYRRLNRFNEAIRCYEKSLELDPKGSVPLGSMATAYELQKNFKKAAEYQMKLVEYYPDDPEGYYGAGRVLYADGQYEKGLEQLCEAYLRYKATNSPYIHDAETLIATIYSDLKEKNQMDIFDRVAKKYNINIK